MSDDVAAALSSTSEIVADMRNGRMVILVDDEGRENEGDLILPAQMVTPDHINFMATHGRGLICLAMDTAMIERLGLTKMVRRNTEAFSTAFTVSIEARVGVSTGISAPDRARTIQVAIDPQSGPADIATPGHIFPLQAVEGGTLVRAGHTEASVDLARLAGLQPAGVICEIMNDDGTMARLPDLIRFAQRHHIKVGTIAGLIAHRLQNEQLIARQAEQMVESAYGGTFRMITYRHMLNGSEAYALVKGQIHQKQPTLVRMHSLSVPSDILGVGASALHKAMTLMADSSAGVVVLLKGMDDAGADPSQILRRTGFGAQILRDVGVGDMVLLRRSQNMVTGLQGFGLNVLEQRTID